MHGWGAGGVFFAYFLFSGGPLCPHHSHAGAGGVYFVRRICMGVAGVVCQTRARRGYFLGMERVADFVFIAVYMAAVFVAAEQEINLLLFSVL